MMRFARSFSLLVSSATYLTDINQTGVPRLPVKERDDDERLASPMPYDDRSASPTAERVFLAAACTADHEPDAES